MTTLQAITFVGRMCHTHDHCGGVEFGISKSSAGQPRQTGGLLVHLAAVMRQLGPARR